MSRESRSADKPNNVSSILQSKKLAWPWPGAVAEHVRGGAKTKDKGMLREKDEVTVRVSVEKSKSVNREVRECELHCRDSVASVVERMWSA